MNREEIEAELATLDLTEALADAKAAVAKNRNDKTLTALKDAKEALRAHRFQVRSNRPPSDAAPGEARPASVHVTTEAG